MPLLDGDRAAAARTAYNSNDVGASKDLHDAPDAAPENHGGGTVCGKDLGDNIKSIVFGGACRRAEWGGRGATGGGGAGSALLRQDAPPRHNATHAAGVAVRGGDGR